MKSLLFIGALACLHLVSSQCTIESLDNSMVASLLARSLVAGTQSNPPTVTVRDYTIVCLAVSTNINQYRLASVVVEYDCTGTCPGGTSGVLSQVEFGCNINVWSEGVAGTSENNIRTPPAQATLRTPLRSDCHTCINPMRETSSEQPNHCISCSGCLPPDQGLNMCTGTGASQCCNVNISGQCRSSCTPGTTPDPNFICRASCTDPVPTALYQTGVLDDSNCTHVGCNATYTCDEGLTLFNGSETYLLRCLESGTTINWDQNTRTCSQQCNFVHNHSAAERGITPTYEPTGCNTTFGTTNCVATYISGNESASCNCTRNDTTGMIRCFSEEVMRLILDTPTITPSTPGGLTTRDIIIIVVVVIAGVTMIALTIVLLGGITYYYYKKNKKEETTDKFQLASRQQSSDK